MNLRARGFHEGRGMLPEPTETSADGERVCYRLAAVSLSAP